MPRKVYYWDKENKKFVEHRPIKGEDYHFINDDSMPACEHPITGEVFESKSAFRRVTKAHGCVEVGNDLLGRRNCPKLDAVLTDEKRKEVIKASIEELKDPVKLRDIRNYQEQEREHIEKVMNGRA